MDQLAISGRELMWAVWHVLVALGALAKPYLPLAAWVGWWLFAVDWVRFRRILVEQAGWLPVVLVAVAIACVWSLLDPSAGGMQRIAGWDVSPLVGNVVVVTTWVVIAWICGAVQLAGAREQVRISQPTT